MKTVRPLLALLLLCLALSQASCAVCILCQLQQHLDGSAEAMYCSPLYLIASLRHGSAAHDHASQ